MVLPVRPRRRHSSSMRLRSAIVAAALMSPCFEAADEKARLYHFPLFSSSRVVQLIVELKITDIDVVALSYNQIKEYPYRNVNPHGTVPAYQEGDVGLLESAA